MTGVVVIPRWVCRWDWFWSHLGEIAVGIAVVAFFGAIAATVAALNLSMLSTVLPWVPDPFAGVYHITDPVVGISIMLAMDAALGYIAVTVYLCTMYGPASERRAVCRRPRRRAP